MNDRQQSQQPIVKIPLHFKFQPIEIISKQLTKFNSNHPERIVYLGARWDNSITFHKKYSSHQTYPFNHQCVSKNASFLYESMISKQYYKTQLYYRAFQGVNPTLNTKTELIFESRFQSGNLDCAIKVNQNEYDLFLRIDSNTRGHLFWYYFSVKSNVNKRVKFNICNMTKNDSHYSKGLNPFMFSSKTKSWTQQNINRVNFQQKRLRYEFVYQKITVSTLYELSFEFQIEALQQLRFAYCIPYTYSQLLMDINALREVAQLDSLGNSLTGVNIPLVKIGKQQQHVKKKMIIITGRIHPSESNSSIMIAQLMKYLCFSQQAQIIRQNLITIIIPMINPDGVILGNSRAGAAGKDLNRCFKIKNKAVFPQIAHLKRLILNFIESHQIMFYLDIHGHSRRKNMFLFGPNYPIGEPLYYKCRILPKILSSLTPNFRYYGCNYDIPLEKKQTARAVMLSQMCIPFVYTIECSLGFYNDYTISKVKTFTKQRWQELGQTIIKGIIIYFQGYYQYQQFAQSKQKSKKFLSQNHQKISKNSKQLLFFKICQQIKQLQKGISQQRKLRQQDENSDDYNECQQMQKQKQIQFKEIITQSINEEYKKNRMFVDEKKKEEKSQKQRKRFRIMMKRKRESFSREDQYLNLNMEVEDKKNIGRTKKKSYDNIQQKQSSSFQQSQKKQIKRLYSIKNKDNNYENNIKQICQSDKDLNAGKSIKIGEKRSIKMNINMFNFSKVVSGEIDNRYKEKKLSVDLQRKKQSSKTIKLQMRRVNQRINNCLKQADYKSPISFYKMGFILDNDAHMRQDQDFNEGGEESYTLSSQHIAKRQYVIPSTLYKMKYKNHKKKLQRKILHKNNVYSPLRNNPHLQITNSKERYNSLQNKQGQFIPIKKFPLI